MAMLRDDVEEEYLWVVRVLDGRNDDVKAAERSTTRASARKTAMRVGRESMVSFSRNNAYLAHAEHAAAARRGFVSRAHVLCEFKNRIRTKVTFVLSSSSSIWRARLVP